MSAATELDWDCAPDWAIPSVPRRPERLATVTTLHRPPERAVTPPVRLTRRGAYVAGAAVVLLAIALVTLARLSAPSAVPTARPSAPDTVTVQAGDTLWSIASRLAPQADPQAEVAQLQRINRLSGAALVPGQVLRTH